MEDILEMYKLVRSSYLNRNWSPRYHEVVLYRIIQFKCLSPRGQWRNQVERRRRAFHVRGS